ncbi:hypothetical protein LF41_1099 [Lysobacter dokdonensis DS-58]|uniref:7-cyano-7-deazaguanine synthase n=1 Tax=Lysobacter dokdonensis DS-58 TaxID=1300345 RepID=A0A0A2WP99_9GAMM|nr:hypothetical protein [Lysobacter dokdonensis]KGQ20562.1 hypothetical protein LF41_1099 [Lysobacter dokdonensis DS-58]
MERTPVNLLWTGGWDSTFQLMRLLLVHGVSVEPIYLMDHTRGSLHVELRTMERIREALATAYPQTRQLLLSTRIADVDALAPDPEIEHAYRRILRTHPIGSQYPWIARFLAQHDLRDVEMGSEFTHHGASEMLIGRTEAITTKQGYASFRLSPDARDSDIGALFGRLAFPLAQTDKAAMKKEADVRGWIPILGMTWFCHKPLRGQPCGMCNPCQGVMSDGFGWRIPPSRRALGAVHRATIGPLKKTTKRILQKFRGAYLTPPAITH